MPHTSRSGQESVGGGGAYAGSLARRRPLARLGAGDAANNARTGVQSLPISKRILDVVQSWVS